LRKKIKISAVITVLHCHKEPEAKLCGGATKSLNTTMVILSQKLFMCFGSGQQDVLCAMHARDLFLLHVGRKFLVLLTTNKS